jgi:oxygen-independent coproporphyrinogen-3 oxidase
VDDAPDRAVTPLGVYVHVPWCAARCAYCAFPVYLTAGGRSTFAQVAAQQLSRQAAALLGDRGRRPVGTVFFGGGTPTLLPPAALGAVLRAIDGELGLAPGAELTVEANPDSVTPRSLAELRALGFTRVSLGMQSAAPHVLALLGRTHTADRPAEAAREARAAGFDHVGLDLIYGTPGETADDWRRSLDVALAAGPDHVSAYALTVERGTRLHAEVRRGALEDPDPDAMADRYLAADAALEAAGLRWYEISNWAASAAARCRHNEGYWRGGDWLALGPGAHGHVAGVRWSNLRHPAGWAARPGAVAQREVLSPEERELERLMLGIRTSAGLPRAGLSALAVEELIEEGVLEPAGDDVVLTLNGRLIADHAIRRLATPSLPAPC